MSDPNDLTAFKGMVPKPGASVGGMGRPKRKRPTKVSATRIAEIRGKKCQSCRLCGTSERVNAHHLIPRGMGGTIGGEWTESNSDAEYSYICGKAGEGWLARRYPVKGVDAA